MTKHNIWRNSILCLILLLPALPAWSAAKNDDVYWYRVEVVVFARTSTAALENEFWPEDPGSFDIGNVVELIPEDGDARLTGDLRVPGGGGGGRGAAARADAFQILNGKDYDLNPKVYALRKNSGYRVLLHTAWNQPAFDAETKRAVYLHDRLPLPFAGAERVSEDSADGPNNYSLYGTLRVYVSRFLHVDLDLIYRIPQQVTYYEKIDQMKSSIFQSVEDTKFTTSSEPVVTVAQRGYRLKESRRIKSKELHYFDHPLYGVLLLTTPLDVSSDGTPAVKTSRR